MVIVIGMTGRLIEVTLLAAAVARKGNYRNKATFNYVSMLAWWYRQSQMQTIV